MLWNRGTPSTQILAHGMLGSKTEKQLASGSVAKGDDVEDQAETRQLRPQRLSLTSYGIGSHLRLLSG